MENDSDNIQRGLDFPDRALKRGFDLLLALLLLLPGLPLMLLAIFAAAIDTRSSGLFFQQRIGRNGKSFNIIKVKTMRDGLPGSTVTIKDDPRITATGQFLRNWKLDELPQLVNILLGHMSFVGPRPDVAEYYELVGEEDRLVYSVRPGITGPATLKYRREEEILQAQSDPEQYNREVIFPDKVAINKAYVQSWSFFNDVKFIVQTFTSIAK